MIYKLFSQIFYINRTMEGRLENFGKGHQCICKLLVFGNLMHTFNQKFMILRRILPQLEATPLPMANKYD